MQEEQRLKQERNESAHVASTSKDKDKRKRTEKPKNEVVQHKRNKIKVTIVSFVVSLDM